MYKKSFFRGLGIGLVIGALTMTVAYNAGGADKRTTDKGSSLEVTSQADAGEAADDNTDKVSTAADKDSSEEQASKEEADKAADKVKNEDELKAAAQAGRENADKDKADKSETANDITDNDKTENDKSDKTSQNNEASTESAPGGNEGGLSDNTERVPSASDNGYTEDKNNGGDSTVTEGEDSTDTSSGQEEKKPESSPQPEKSGYVKYDNGGGEITIVKGMTAYEICELLEKIGLRDADEYYDWLLRSGYSKSLVAGTYTFTGNESNGGIVWILLGNQ